MVLRDIDLLKQINEASKCVVLMKMQKANIPTIVWFTTILPFINDTEENISGILKYCKQAGVKGNITFGMGMTLRYGNREYYYKKLEEHSLSLKKEYMKKYGSAYGLKSHHNAKLSKLIKSFMVEKMFFSMFGISHRNKSNSHYLMSHDIKYQQFICV